MYKHFEIYEVLHNSTIRYISSYNTTLKEPCGHIIQFQFLSIGYYLQITPGVSSLAGDNDRLKNHVVKLVDEAKTQVPKENQRSTILAFMATAGNFLQDLMIHFCNLSSILKHSIYHQFYCLKGIQYCGVDFIRP